MFPGVTAHSNLHNPGSEDEPLEENLWPGPLVDAEDYIRDADELFGQRGDDTLRAQDEDHADILKGGKGFDTCYADAFDILYSCEDPHILPGERA